MESMKSKTLSKLKRTVSGILALAMTASVATVLPASAEEEQPSKYPYAIFAADDQGGITLELDSFTLNGNGYTNGVFETTAQYPNINGTISVLDDIEADETVTDGEDSDNSFDVSKDMIFIHNKLMDSWFTENCQTYDEDYLFADMNINLNTPVYVTGRLSYDGNVGLNTAIGAVSDVTLTGGNLNGNNAVIYSKFGDIKITDNQASMNGLIYAPFGTVTIDCDNFNMDGMIIAQNVVIDSYGANINYNNSWAEFVGTETEELSWTFDDWQYLADTDEDGLPNLIEKEIGTDQYDPDSDGDLLPDGYEVLTLGTDPLKPDTDDNGISDYDDDFDSDGLTNGQEYELGTEPYNEDTDGDTLSDGDEINTYFTNPLEVDTDGDGLNDDDEIYFGTDPNDPDSDDNGILDGDEKRFQTFIHKVENEDCVITEVRVSMEATGNLQKTTTVKSVMNRDNLCTDVVGLVGEPFSIETTSEFDTATLTYVIDKDKLGDTEFDNLLFLWYNEAEDEFVELDTILDEENSTVSIETTHFSKYMLVDQVEWFEAWKRASLYFEDEYEPLASVICYDCSGSMSWNDGNFLYNIYNENGTISYSYSTCYRKLAIDNFIDSMTLTDKTALISFESSANLVSGFSYDKDELKSLVKPYNGGGTNVRAAIDMAIDEFENVEHWYTRHIILLSDGDVNLNINLSNNVVDELIKEAVDNNIKIHTIGLGSGANNQKLRDCADYTGGEFYIASTAEELNAIYMDLSQENHFDLKSLPDEDHDGLPDEFEVSGLVISNAQVYYTDPEIQDCDGDDLFDGQEISIDDAKSKTVTVHGADGGYTTYSTVVFSFNSDPWDKDTDYDGIEDGIDLHKCETTCIGNLEMDYRSKYEKKENASDDLIICSKDIEYSLCFKDFFSDNSDFSRNLSTASAVFSSIIYDGDYFVINSLPYSAFFLLEHHGFKDLKRYDISEGSSDFLINKYNDNHISEICIGHQEVTYNGVTKDIVAVIIRGTNGTVEEWASNFDLGSTEELSTYNFWNDFGRSDSSGFDDALNYLLENNMDELNAFSDWKRSDNHKGFDISTNRILRYINSYVNKYVDNEKATFWITGHSRGAAIANLLASYLIDNNEEVYCYTFACPGTTTDLTCHDSKYNCIFNIINSDDFVPQIPTLDWGFGRYGIDKILSLGNDYKTEWNNMTGKSYSYTNDLDDTINSLSNIAKDENGRINRNNCYKWTCECHGDNSFGIESTAENYGLTSKSRKEAKEKIPQNARPFAIISDFGYVRYNFKICQTPEYFLQIIAAQMSGEIAINNKVGLIDENWRFLAEIDLATLYSEAKWSLISARNYIKHPHYLESYYILSKYV